MIKNAFVTVPSFSTSFSYSSFTSSHSSSLTSRYTARRHVRTIKAVLDSSLSSSSSSSRITTRSSKSSSSYSSSYSSSSSLIVTRRNLLKSLLLSYLALATFSSLDPHYSAALAVVDFDVDIYGDKELKVSTINRIKQNFRNAISENPSVLPSLFELEVLDALTFNKATGAGGPNAGVRAAAAVPEHLAEANAAVESVKAKMKDVSFADLMAFAGSVASEITNGPRIRIQLGRDDVKKAALDIIKDDINRVPVPPLGSGADDARQAWVQKLAVAGATNPSRDLVLLYGAFQVFQTVAKKKQSEKNANAIDANDDEDEEDFQGDDMVYGKVDKRANKRGAAVVSSDTNLLKLQGAKFDNEYLKALADYSRKGDVKNLSPFDQALLQDQSTKNEITKYAANSKAFATDFADLYEAMTLYGSRYSGVKLLSE